MAKRAGPLGPARLRVDRDAWIQALAAFLAAGFFAAGFLAAVFFAVAFFTAGFFTGAASSPFAIFLAAAFFAAGFFAAGFFAAGALAPLRPPLPLPTFSARAASKATAASIDLAVARSHSANRSAAQAPTQRTITIGSAGTRGLRTYVQLFVVIAAANDVRCDVASNSTFVYAYGFAEDIDASHALYASLVVQMVRASDSYLASGAHRPTPTITAAWVELGDLEPLLDGLPDCDVRLRRLLFVNAAQEVGERLLRVVVSLVCLPDVLRFPS